jgi:hypothetical protein
MARSHHNQTHGRKEGHKRETLSTAPYVKNLREGDINSGSDGVRNDIDRCQERVRVPVAGNVWQETRQDRGLKGVDEVEEPYAVEGSVREG